MLFQVEINYAGLVVLILLMVILLGLYIKYKKFELMLLVFAFSLFIFFESLSDVNIPFTPWFQLFFIGFQSFIIIFTSVAYYEEKKGIDDID